MTRVGLVVGSPVITFPFPHFVGFCGMVCPSAPHPYPYLPSSLCSLLRDSLVAKLVRIHRQSRRPGFNSSVQKIAWRRDRLPISVCLDFPGGSAGKELTCSAGYLDLIPGLGRSPGEGKGYPLQYSGLDNSMNYVVHGLQRVGQD